MFGLGIGEIVACLAVAGMLFGFNKLPEMGTAIGKTFVNLKKGAIEAKRECALIEADTKRIVSEAAREVEGV